MSGKQSPNAPREASIGSWFERGDIDGFFGLALDNFIQLLLIANFCEAILNFPSELIYGRILPGAAVSVLAGNIFYAWQARALARRTGRSDVCALPYGINTVSLFGHVFLIMLPAKIVASAAGASPERAAQIAWHAGLVATAASGIIEIAAAFFAERIRRATPRAALLSTLAGIALSFISLGFLLQTFAHPLVGFTGLAIVMLTYFGRVRFKFGLPGGLIAVALGTALAWLTHVAPGDAAWPATGISFHAPLPALRDICAAFSGDYIVPYLSVIIPMGLFNVIGSLQNIESAEAAGDAFATRPALLMNGFGSVAAALFGSCFPTTIYIGHPGWKALGARRGYSILNGVGITLLCLSGTLTYAKYLVPIDAGMAIVLWIGMVITAQAFQTVPRAHAPAVVVGILPAVAAWGAMIAINALHVAGLGTLAHPFGPELLDKFRLTGTWIHGAFALQQGFIFASLVLAAATVGVIERRWNSAALWCAIAALLAATGLIHSYEIRPTDIGMPISGLWHPAWEWACGYAIMAVLFFAARWTTDCVSLNAET
jgi:AGZA family xanthine/uracil permease-like MFS transporter